MAAPPELPDDMIFEILTRISLEDTDACKCVCRGWKHMMEGLDFMSVYCERTKNLFGFFIQSLDHNLKIVSKFVSAVDQPMAERSWDGGLGSGFRILASCNGILCCRKCKDDFHHIYYLYKPTTQQFLEVPPPYYSKSEAIGMVVLGSSPLRYKIASVFKRDLGSGNGYKFICEVFDSDFGNWYFGESQDFPQSMKIIQFTPCIFLHGSFHWLCNDDTILTYNIDQRSFHRFFLPGFMHYCKCLVEYEGELGILLMREGKIEHGVMRNYWRQVKVIDIASLKKDGDKKRIMPCGFYNADIILVKMGDEVVFYNIGDASFRRVKLGDNVRHVLQAFPFRSDWNMWIQR